MYWGEMRKSLTSGDGGTWHASSTSFDLDALVEDDEAEHDDVVVVAVAVASPLVRIRFFAWRERSSCSSSLTKSIAPAIMDA